MLTIHERNTFYIPVLHFIRLNYIIITEKFDLAKFTFVEIDMLKWTIYDPTEPAVYLKADKYLLIYRIEITPPPARHIVLKKHLGLLA